MISQHEFWLDAQLPPLLASWLAATMGIEAVAIRDLGLRDTSDVEIFEAARSKAAIPISKDADFVGLVERRGVPPQLLWVTCGNSSNARMKKLFSVGFPAAIQLLTSGAPIVELADI